jgi:hypothetical protein
MRSGLERLRRCELGIIAAISLCSAACTVLAVAVFEIGATASVWAEVYAGFEKLATYDGITWYSTFSRSYMSSIELLTISMGISLRVVLKACLASQTASARLREPKVASRLDKVEDYVGVDL